ncbi:ribonuclease H-like domain-containing protein [Tanacetum coccineum]
MQESKKKQGKIDSRCRYLKMLRHNPKNGYTVTYIKQVLVRTGIKRLLDDLEVTAAKVCLLQRDGSRLSTYGGCIKSAYAQTQMSMTMEDNDEQYIQMIDYSLWEVIENGNAPPITKVVETIIAPTTAEEKAQMRLDRKKVPTNLHSMAYSLLVQTLSIKDLRTSKLNAIAYKTGLESIEARLLVYKKNKSVYEEDIKVLKREIHLREVAITELRRKLELAQKQKDEIQLTVENFENSSKSLSKLIDCQIVDKCKTGLGYNVVPPPYTGNFMPLKPDLSFSGLEEFVNEPIVSEPTVKKHVVKNSEAKASEAKPKAVRKNNAVTNDDVVLVNPINTARQVNVAHSKTIVNAARPKSHFSKIAHSIIKRPIHKNTSFKNSNLNQRVNTVNTARPKAVVNAVKGNNVNVVKASACWVWKPKTKVLDHVSKHNSASITLKKFDYGNPQQDLQEKGVIDSGCSRHMTGNMSYLTDFEEIDGGYVAFRGNPKGGKITGKDQKVKVIRCDNGTEFKNKEMNQFCERKGIKKEFSVARTPQQNGVAERKNRTLIEAARTMLADSKLPTTFWAEAVNTACYVQNRVLVTKPHNKTPYELFLGRKPALGFMRPFGCPVTILNTIDHLGKFDGKADEGFFVGYSINRSGPNWLFDIDALTKSMNYKPVVARNQSNGNAGTKACDEPGKARMKKYLAILYSATIMD